MYSFICCFYPTLFSLPFAILPTASFFFAEPALYGLVDWRKLLLLMEVHVTVRDDASCF